VESQILFSQIQKLSTDDLVFYKNFTFDDELNKLKDA